MALLLRNAILKIFETKKSQENKGDKMSFLYDYLTGNEFRNCPSMRLPAESIAQIDLMQSNDASTAHVGRLLIVLTEVAWVQIGSSTDSQRNILLWSAESAFAQKLFGSIAKSKLSVR